MSSTVRHTLAAAIGLTAIATSPVLAQEYKAGAIKIEAPWIRATPAGAEVAGGYMKLKNTGKEPDRLVGGSTEIAGKFQVHEMSMSGGMMKMRELGQGLELKPGKSVELKPGSYHVMMLELKHPLKEGDRVKGTLVFEKAGTVDVEYAVRSMGAKGKAPAGGHGMSGHDGTMH
ncbi:MAG TPA: copper chaperone PCu(A)C [Hyphomicrobiaceae bacterium]|jgi:copper(I)-binding protein